MLAVHGALLEAGRAHDLRHFGMYAMDSLRIDKCYRVWKADLETGYSPLEASLDRFVDFNKGLFVGKDALLAQRSRGVAHRLVPLFLDQPGDADPPYCSSVFSGEDNVGLVTSGLWSHTLDRAVVLAYVKSPFATEGTKLLVDVLGERRMATVAREPLFDPDNRRPRG
jgi:dimethylglycine dehydrogenase